MIHEKDVEMNTLIYNIALLSADPSERFCLSVKDKHIAYIGKERPREQFDRTVDGRGRLLTPAFYNAHTHAAMTLFRGYGEDLPLHSWLHDRIFPAEERLNEKNVYYGSMVAIAEMIRNGIVSFSDMYFFCESTAAAVGESGIKANLSRSIVSFDETADPQKDTRVAEAETLFSTYNGAFDGRITVDFSLHAEYTNTESMTRYVADMAKDYGARVQIHLSETEKEHTEGFLRRGITPTEFFYKCGIFRVPVTAAHGVFLTDNDRRILAENGATVVHNPISNLKLGSGILPLRKTVDAGINVALGTDGAASNNRLDILREMQMAVLLAKGTSHAPESFTAKEGFALATRNGALSQGRADCGEIRVGNRADLLLWDLDTLHNLPVYDGYTTLQGSALSSDVSFTMADGRILYEDGAFTTVDTEKLCAEWKEVCRHYFD